MEHRPPSRLGLLFGLGMIWRSSCWTWDWPLLLTSPLDLLSVVRALLVIDLAGHGHRALWPDGAEECQLPGRPQRDSIRWGQAEQISPFLTWKKFAGADLGRVARFRGIRWPGCWVGRGRVEGVGPVQFYCTSPLHHHLVIRTALVRTPFPPGPGKVRGSPGDPARHGGAGATEHG